MEGCGGGEWVGGWGFRCDVICLFGHRLLWGMESGGRRVVGWSRNGITDACCWLEYRLVFGARCIHGLDGGTGKRLTLTNESLSNREVVALSRWQIPQTLSADQKAEKDRLDNSPLPKPDGWDKVLEKEFSDALDERYGKWVDDSKDYCASRFSHSPCLLSLSLSRLQLSVSTND